MDSSAAAWLHSFRAASGSFQMSQLFPSGGQSTGISLLLHWQVDSSPLSMRVTWAGATSSSGGDLPDPGMNRVSRVSRQALYQYLGSPRLGTIYMRLPWMGGNRGWGADRSAGHKPGTSVSLHPLCPTCIRLGLTRGEGSWALWVIFSQNCV